MGPHAIEYDAKAARQSRVVRSIAGPLDQTAAAIWGLAPYGWEEHDEP